MNNFILNLNKIDLFDEIMKKIIYIIIIIVAVICIALGILWHNRAKLLSHILSKSFHITVIIEKVVLTRDSLVLINFEVKNPLGSQTESAFSAEAIEIKATIKELLQKRLTVESIAIKNIVLGVEFYVNSGQDNNWRRIMLADEDIGKDSSRQYLIKKLTLDNLQVYLIKPYGRIIKFPIIPHLEFYNINNETGFPINRIEKALFNVVLRSIFQQFGLGNLIQTLNPFSLIPKILEFPFSKKEVQTQE